MQGISDIILFSPSYSIPEDFTFIVDKKKYYCHKFVVFNLSNFLYTQVQNNKNLNSWTIPDIKDPHNYFQIIVDYFHGKKKKLINQENSIFISAIANYLQVNELLMDAQEYIPRVTTENILYVMKLYSELNIPSFDCAQKIAMNWSQYNQKPELMDLPPFAFSQIFRELKNITQKDLFDFIKKLVEIHDTAEYIALFQYCFLPGFEQNDVNDILYHIIYNQTDSIDPNIIKILVDRIDLPH